MKKLLLADDSVTIQKVVRLSFAGEDIEVWTADNGDAAVEALERNRPDIVLTDIYMPGRSGFAVCEYIKSNPQLSHIPVILLVGIFEPFDQEEASRARCDGVLTKPFETQQLIHMVEELLHGGLTQARPAEMQAAAEELPLATLAEPSRDFAEPQPDFAMPFETTAAVLTWDRPVWPEGAIEEDCILDIFDHDEAPLALPTMKFEIPEPGPDQPPAAETARAEERQRIEVLVPVPPPEREPIPGAGRADAGLLNDSQIELIVERVLRKLSDQAVRDVVWQVVPELAERIIRDELRNRTAVS